MTNSIAKLVNLSRPEPPQPLFSLSFALSFASLMDKLKKGEVGSAVWFGCLSFPEYQKANYDDCDDYGDC